MHSQMIGITELGNGFIVSIPMMHKRNEYYQQGLGIAEGFVQKQNEDDILKMLQEKNNEPEFEYSRSAIMRPGEFYFSSVNEVTYFISEILMGTGVEAALKLTKEFGSK